MRTGSTTPAFGPGDPDSCGRSTVSSRWLHLLSWILPLKQLESSTAPQLWRCCVGDIHPKGSFHGLNSQIISLAGALCTGACGDAGTLRTPQRASCRLSALTVFLSSTATFFTNPLYYQVKVLWGRCRQMRINFCPFNLKCVLAYPVPSMEHTVIPPFS